MGKFLDKFRPGDYLRELSVVILGVAVTFAGSAMITNHTVRKNIKENMRLIKIELEKNVMKLHEAMDYIAADVHIGREHSAGYAADVRPCDIVFAALFLYG